MDANAPPFNPSFGAQTDAFFFGDPSDDFKNDGFQLVSGKKKRASRSGNEKEGQFLGSVGRSRVPFHLASIRKPQDEYLIRVNNENRPFDHVWLEKVPDGSRYVHPLEKFSVENFVDRKLVEGGPVKPLALESTLFKFVETVNDLRELVANLRAVDEFAVDLEHNHYRSFQGLTCLMQISTRVEDFVVDTLKLRMHVGPYLREFFKDPSKRKVMHGADHDILWLQRDFGIYVCNLFDTGQASRVLQLERNSLEHLLHHFCEVTANKEYQNADWRLRPLPDEMIKYAREDTHYLLYIYDIMKSRLLSASSNENDLLLEVYKRSAETCMQLYEKELLNDTSYLYIYGLSDADLNAEQLAVVAGLSQWRDNIARAEDESTGYILPNKTLLEIAKQMPLNAAKLKRLIKTKHPFIESNIHSILGIVRSSVLNSAAFENAAQQLKNARLEASRMQNMGTVTGNMDRDDGMHAFSEPIITSLGPKEFSFGVPDFQLQNAGFSSVNRVEEDSIIPSSWLSSVCKKDEEHIGNQGTERKATVATFQLPKNTSAFGPLFGNSSSERNIVLDTRISEQAENANSVNHIKSGVTLPFYYFSGERSIESHGCAQQPLEEENEDRESPSNGPIGKDGINDWGQFHPSIDGGSEQTFKSEIEVTEDVVSSSDLISSFEKCFPSISESRGSPKGRKQH